MSTDEWWVRWSSVWWAIGWRALAERSNYNVSDALDIMAALITRVRRLEALEQQTFFRGLF